MNKNLFLLSGLILCCSYSVSGCFSGDHAPVNENKISAPALPRMVVHKTPTCGCCKDWISYIEKAGFSVDAIDHDNLDVIKIENGLTNPALMSCHTAIIDDYIIEGHVPVSDIQRLLAERPDVAGLTAPGMPMMSPGMGSETPMDYDVLAFDKHGRAYIYSSY